MMDSTPDAKETPNEFNRVLLDFLKKRLRARDYSD